MQRTLYVDAVDNHSEEDNCITIHPAHLNYVDSFDKEAFNKVIIKNSPAEFLKSKGLFNIYRTLKNGGICEIIVDQPIYVMQELDAGEIEANCKLAGFDDVSIQSHSFIENVNGNEKKVQTLKLTMVK